MKIEELVKYFFSVRTQVHLWHIQTQSYAEHKALGSFYDNWLDLSDSFIEAYCGKYGRPTGGMAFNVLSYSSDAPLKYMKGISEYMLSKDLRSIASDSDLNNILDEMAALAKTTSYLLTLK